MIAIGVVIFVAGASGTGFLAFTTARGVNWNPYKPAWLLIRELRASTPATATAAGKELAARLAKGEISRRATEKVIDAALDLQSDPTAIWDGDISEVLTEAREQGVMESAQLGRFICQSMSMWIDIPVDLMVGEPVRIMHGVAHDATAHWMNVSVLVSYEVEVDGKSVDAMMVGADPPAGGEPMRMAPHQYISGFTNGVVNRAASGTQTAVFHLVFEMPPGEHQVLIRLRNQGVPVDAVEWEGSSRGAPPVPRTSRDVLASWVIEQRFEVQVRE